MSATNYRLITTTEDLQAAFEYLSKQPLVGFDTETTTEPRRNGGRLGLMGMRERVAMVGGTLHIESSPGSSTTVFVQIPLHEVGGHIDG